VNSLLNSRTIRNQILSERDRLTSSQIRQKSSQIINMLLELEPYKVSHLPMFYVSFRSEVYTHDIIKTRLAKGLKVVVPQTIIGQRRLIPRLIENWDRDLRTGAYGILEPDPVRTRQIDPSILDLVVAPGSVFDKRCGRYGYGGGYYDRFLSEKAPHALRLALCFDLQVMEQIPLKEHDQRMDIIVTESRIITCNDRPLRLQQAS